MLPGIEYLASFIAGIICMPFIVETYGYLREWQIEKKYNERLSRMKYTHDLTTSKLVDNYNEAAENHNKQLSKVEKKLAKKDLKVIADEDGNELVVRQMRVKTPFFQFLRQRG